MLHRRHFMLGSVALATGLLGRVSSANGERVIAVTARKFEFSPSVILLKQGETVTLELSTADVFMGFSAPDFGVRADIMPGKTRRVTINATRSGEFHFLCDVFCGSGHEDMSGKIVVKA